MHVVYYTNMIDAPDNYQLPAASEVRNYDPANYSPNRALFAKDGFEPFKNVARVPFELRETTRRS